MGFAADGDTFLGLHRLVDALRPAPPRHGAARVFIDDDDLAFLHHVVDVAPEQEVRLESGLDMVQEAQVRSRVEAVVFAQEL